MMRMPANKRMVLTLPARGSYGIITAIQVWCWFCLRSAAQGAGGPHMRGVTQTLYKRAALFDKLRKTLRLNPKADGSKQDAAIKSEQIDLFI